VKMRLFDRILLALYILTIFAFSLCLLGISVGLIPLDSLAGAIESIDYNTSFILASLGISLLFILISLRLIISTLAGRKPASSLLKQTDFGTIRVSVNTLDGLTKKAVRTFEEVKDVKTSILTETDGIKVRLKVNIMPDVKMPDLTQAIQAKVKDYIEEYSGIHVKEVHVYIDNQVTVTKNRVE